MPFTDEEANVIFSRIKKCMEKCSPPMVISKASPTSMELIGNKAVPYGYKKEIVPGMYFSSVVIRKSMVSFYFFPMYMNPVNFKELAPTLFKTLKGKTCFNIKSESSVPEKELHALFKRGVEVWVKLGYMENL